MNDNPLSISRRRVLAGLGAVGIASAGAGLGTSAFFNDTESFENNVLTAGELDLKVDWQHKYYGPATGDIYGSAGRPFVNAYPDVDGDGQHDTLLSRTEIGSADPSLTSDEVEAAYRAQFANVPDDFAMPVIDLDDVKPGDNGCLSLSMHLFDNPGYIWMGGELVSESENGQSEPESIVDGTAGGPGELADAIDAVLWYDDDGDCELDSEGIEGDGDVMIVLDRSGSMTSEPNKFSNAKAGAKTLIDALGANTRVGLVSFASSATLDEPLTTNHSQVKATIDALSAGGSTNMEAAVTTAQAELANAASANPIMVFLTNGVPSVGDPTDEAQAAKNAGTEIYTIAYGSGANVSLLNDMSSDPDSQYSYLATDIASVEQVFAQIGQIIAGEQIIVQGSLRDVLAALEAGIPLDGNRVEADRQCFVNSTTQYVGLAWTLPTDVGNEVQTDTLTFDLSLYAEQCRHNDGTNNPFGTPA
jgi:predicted ribosomally synthesized peptide with SipW-like signal peptide